jgi:hypothetical protein
MLLIISLILNPQSISRHTPSSLSPVIELHAGLQGTHTNTHQNQKPRTEPSKIHDCIATALDKIIWIGASSADPIW